MNPDHAAASPSPAELFDPPTWLAQHPPAAVGLAAFCLCMSLWLILCMWLAHRRDSFAKKFVWTFFLFVPFLGWIFYAAFFHPSGYSDTPGFASQSYE